MIRQVKDLSADQKMALESLLGRPVSEHETVSVQAFEAPAVSWQRRQEITEALRSILPRWTRNASLFPLRKPTTSSTRR